MDRPTFAALRLPFLVFIAALALTTASCITPSEFDQKIPNDTGSLDQTSTADGTAAETTAPDVAPDLDQDLATDAPVDGIDDGTTAEVEDMDDGTTQDTDVTSDVVETTDLVDLEVDTCPSSCSTTQECVNGVCVSCTAGFGNCDSESSNGCEAALNTPENCGECGLAEGCDRGGVACSLLSEVVTNLCSECLPGYFDVDGDLDDLTGNGCETRIVDSNTSTLSFNGPVVETTVDSTTGQIFVATVDATVPNHVWVYAIEVNTTTGIASTTGSVDTGAAALYGAVGLAAEHQIVAAARGSQVVFYEYWSGVFTHVAVYTVDKVTSVVAFEPTFAEPYVEFTAGGSSALALFGVLPKTDVLDSGLALCSNEASTALSVCDIEAVSGLSNIKQIAASTRLGAQWLITLAENALIENTVDGTSSYLLPMYTLSTASFATASDLAMTGDTSCYSKGNSIFVLAHQFDLGGIPLSVSETELALQGTISELVILDSTRAAVATNSGLDFVHLGTSLRYQAIDSNATEGVVVFQNWLVAFGTNGETTVYNLELN